MQYYLAPLEGITGYIYRNAHEKVFHNVDKYFSPFLSPTVHNRLTSREKNDVIPEHNQGIFLVPQILTNQTEQFLNTVKLLEEYGYQEVNLNLGCPSGTVVTKKKGAGFLSDPEMLAHFLDEIYANCSVKISIKTRLGMEDPKEFERLLEIFNEYPLEELIIHPRVQKDYYNNKPNWESYEYAQSHTTHSLCYNGDIFTKECYEVWKTKFSKEEKVMLGRGVIANPALIDEINGTGTLTKERWKQFHDEVYEGYQEIMSGEKNTLFKMKELWFYMGHLFEDSDKFLKKIKKANRLKDYEIAVAQLLRERELKR